MSRVPAMDLMRFTCVSKSWCSLISTDPYFSTIQLERTASQHRPFLLLTKKEGQKDGGHLYSSHIWTDLDSVEDRNIGSREREINDPFCDHQFIDQNILHIEDTRVIGSCHGLIVLEQFRSHRMVVTNPTTKKHHLVPPNPANVVFCGFGYDRVHSCYKLVTQIKPASYHDQTLELMVYDVNEGTWRNLQFGMWWRSQIDGEDIYCPLYMHRVKCVDGAVYWCIDQRDRTRFGPTKMKKMVCFLLAEEEFHVVETPDFGEVRNYPNITDLEGRLCLDCKGPNSIEFWMIDMEYDKTQESAYSWRWTKFLVISDLYCMLPPRIRIDRFVPVCFSACKNKILFDINSSELFWYDLANKKFCEVNNHGKAYTKASYCIPSLVGNGIF